LDDKEMEEHINDFLKFLNGSHTSFQASLEIIKRLEVKGFDPLKEDEHWKLEDGNKYYICRDTSVIAFILGKENLRDSGYKIADTILKNK
jgi:aspartyl aminopeptidase